MSKKRSNWIELRKIWKRLVEADLNPTTTSKV